MFTRFCPSYTVNPDDPATNPPPCSHTITGRLRPSVTDGVKTFSTRQSSPCGSLRSKTNHSGTRRPIVLTSRTPVHACGLRGGRKRLAPAVDAPYGMPRNVLTPWKKRPRTRPLVVSTMFVGPPARVLCGNASEGASAAPAAANEEAWRKDLRFISQGGLKTALYARP